MYPRQEDLEEDAYFSKEEGQTSKPAEPANDPLEEYMREVNAALAQERAKKEPKGEDPMEQYFNELLQKSEQKPAVQTTEEDKYDDLMNSEGEIDEEKLKLLKKKKMAPLAEVDHSQKSYERVRTDFYEEDPTISRLTEEQVAKIRADMEIQVAGKDVVRPIVSFDQLIIDKQLKAKLMSMRYERPTPIQCQALPCALKGRDIIGIAKTGSGKTLAYIIPMITHIIDQRMLKRGEGPVGLVLAPTRELCQQIATVASKYASPYKIKVLSLFGGESKQEQWKMLLAGVEVIIATPGRLIDMIRKGAFTLSSRCTFVTVDEADIMFNMGFEYQIRMILGQVRPDRQILMFSATFPPKIQNLVKDVLRNYIKIIVGKLGNPNEDVSQRVVVFENPEEKLRWTMQKLPEFMHEGQVLVFANQIKTVEELARVLCGLYPDDIVYLHGDKMQYERSIALYKFKKGEARILISTNVASRGLDIPQIHTVLNYEPAKDKDDHTHRIGRTGRAGDKTGVAYTLILKSEYNKAGMLMDILETVDQPIPVELEKLARADPKYRAQHQTIGIKSMHTTVDTHKETMELKEKHKGAAYKAGLGYHRPEKGGAKRGKFNQSDTLIGDIGTLAQMQMQRQQFEEAVKLGPIAAKERMQEYYAGQMKHKMTSQLRQGFTSGGAMEDRREKPTVMYLQGEGVVVHEPLVSENPRREEAKKEEQATVQIAGKRKRQSLWDVKPDTK